MYLPGRQRRQRDHVLGAETGVSTGSVRKLSPFSEERVSLPSREAWEKDSHKGRDTLAISSECEGASQDYNP